MTMHIVPIVIHIRGRAERLSSFRRANQGALAACAAACRLAADLLRDEPRVYRDDPGDCFLLFDAHRHRVGRMGCRMSQIHVAKLTAIVSERSGGTVAVMVMEDDALCVRPSLMQELCRSVHLHAFDVLHLGPAFMNGRSPARDGRAAAVPLDGEAGACWVVSIASASLMHALIVSPAFATRYQEILADAPLIKAADDVLRDAMTPHRWRATSPCLFWQQPGRSDIDRVHRDMDDCMRSSDLFLAYLARRDRAVAARPGPDVRVIAAQDMHSHASLGWAFVYHPSFMTRAQALDQCQRAWNVLPAARAFALCAPPLHAVDQQRIEQLFGKADIDVASGRSRRATGPDEVAVRYERANVHEAMHFHPLIRSHGLLLHAGLLPLKREIVTVCVWPVFAPP